MFKIFVLFLSVMVLSSLMASTSEQESVISKFKKIKKYDEYVLPQDGANTNITKVKAVANSFTSDSLDAICYLWANGYYDYVELLWWKKDDPAARTLIVALFWCQYNQLTDGNNTPEGIIPFKDYVLNFNKAESQKRIDEINFVTRNHMNLAKELSFLMANYDITTAQEMKHRYKKTYDVLSRKQALPQK